MPQLPEQIRPYVAALAKYHFWILALIVPLVLVPLLFVGTGSLDSRITAQKSQIESRVSALKGVQGIAEHPNEGWSEAVEAQTQKIQAETLAEWTRFWEDQKFLRVWPAKLGDAFVKAAENLKPGAILIRPLLLRYQNTVPDLVRELPARMGADDLMLEGSVAGGGPEGEMGPRGGRPGFGGEFGQRPGMPGPGGAAMSTALVTWNSADQRRIFESFRWEKAPSTTQVLLAQEELWVYGLLCDAIKRANQGAAGAFNSPITAVEELAVGYLAAEDQPGGQGGARIFMPMAAAAGGGGEMEGMPPPGMPLDMTAGMEGGAAGRPVHPRFGSGGGPMMGRGEFPGPEGGGDPAAVPAGSPDDALREWIYVDFAGKPLTAAEVAASPAAKMVHLMPFVLRVVMDQRRLDALLADLAAAPLPIDVRQVRVNVGSQAGGGFGAGGGGPMGRPQEFSAPASPADASGRRPYDVIVELRGSVGLAPPPDKNVIGGEQPAAVEGGA